MNPSLSFNQWIKLGFGGLAILKLYRENAPVQTVAKQASDLINSVFPPSRPAADGITHTEVIEKIRTGDLTAEEQALFDRASFSTGQ